MYKLKFASKALKELEESAAWYEKQRQGLGAQFEEAVFLKAEQILETPERYPVQARMKRQVAIRKFPFVIIYRIDEDRKIVVITSIFHGKRNPAGKYK
jgi:toxin ParE1/3/4